MSSTPSPWAERADELLADGEWHDGATILREAMKRITPGIAFRKAERTRERSADPPPELSMDKLIAMGKHSIMVALAHNRVQYKAWQIDPWPLAAGTWRTGGWQVRDLRHHRRTIRQMEQQLHLSSITVRDLVFQDPPIDHEIVGARTYVLDVNGLIERAETYRKESSSRRSAACLRSAEDRRTRTPDKLSLKGLGDRTGIGHGPTHAVAKANPQLPWIRRGKVTYLPVEALADWDEAVAKYQAAASERRSAAARAAGRARGRKQAAREDIPTFQDPEVNRLMARRAAGEENVREQLHAAMRRAFQEADDA